MNIEPQEFVNSFAAIFDDTSPDQISISTVYRELEEWSSLSALSLLAIVEDEYGVNLNNQDLRNSTTVGDILDIVNRKKA
jgi:acyl carrier protein